MNSFIPVNRPLLKGNEKKYLNECIDSGWISSEGPYVKKFENSFAKYNNNVWMYGQYGGTSKSTMTLLEIAA